MTDLSLDIYTGESGLSVTLKTDPYFYHPAGNNNFSFICEYNSPSGEVNFGFPDEPCSSFDFLDSYSGESSSIQEIFTDVAYIGQSGEELDLDLLTFKIIQVNSSLTGESLDFSLILSDLFNQDIYSGESGSLNSLFLPVREELSSDGYSSENVYLDLATTTTLSFDSYSGSYGIIPDNFSPIDPSSTFTHLHGNGNYSLTSSCLTMYGVQSGAVDAGRNAYLSLPFQLENNKDITFYFKRTKAVSWNDDDFTDAALWFCFFPNYNPNEITFANYVWGYDKPNVSSFKGSITICMRHSNSEFIRVYHIDRITGATYTNDLSVISDWTTEETNGTHECSIVISANESNTTIQARGNRGVLRQSGTFANMANPFANNRSETLDTFLIHHHNYYGSQYYEKLCDMRIGSQEGFVLVQFSLLGTTNAFTGEVASSDLRTEVILEPRSFSGEIETAILTIYPSISLDSVFSYTGENSSLSYLSTISSLSPISLSGETGFVDFTTYESTQLSLPSYSGEQSVSSLTISRNLIIDAREGTTALFDLTYLVNEGMPSIGQSGESLYFFISTSDSLSLLGYSGEAATGTLNPSYAFHPLAFSGSVSYVELTLNPFDTFSGSALSGENTNLLFNTTVKIPSIGFSGEIASINPSFYQQQSITLQGYGGTNTFLILQTGINLSFINGYSGTLASISQINEEPNIRFYCGESSSSTLATNDIFNVRIYGTGESCSLSLVVNKSEGIGEFRIYSGTSLFSTFDTKHHADLYVLFRTSVMTQVDIGSTTHFDLNTDACCGVRRESLSNNHVIQMFRNDYLPESVRYGNRVDFSFDLQCQPRFTFNFITGESFNLEEYDNYLSINFSEGTECLLNGFEPDLTHKLCKGHFIPNGNWLVVELNDVLPENCYTDVVYTGTTLSCELSDDIVLRFNDLNCDESLSPNLTTFPPWLLIFYSGEDLHCVLSIEQALYVNGGSSECLFVTLYEEPYLGYSGETCDLEIEIEYHVRFKETGCLDNDFVFQNDSGDLIPELTNPVPVEGEPFYHSVLADCV